MTEESLLYDLIDMEDPLSVLEEVKSILFLVFPQFDFDPLKFVFEDVVRLFMGQYPGYQECTTDYHDLEHTTDTFLAMARLVHGATVAEQRFSPRGVTLGLVTALLHDTGYIQTLDNGAGTGGKYTTVHIDRSIEFLEKYLKGQASPQEIEYCNAILKCSGLEVDFDGIYFVSREHKTLGKMLGTADLMGQMANRAYLEKLLFLYHEFNEAGIPGLESELALLKNTPGFFEATMARIRHEFGNVHNYMLPHFETRWHIKKDLYQLAATNNIRYLEIILKDHQKNYRDQLRRRILPLK